MFGIGEYGASLIRGRCPFKSSYGNRAKFITVHLFTFTNSTGLSNNVRGTHFRQETSKRKKFSAEAGKFSRNLI